MLLHPAESQRILALVLLSALVVVVSAIRFAWPTDQLSMSTVSPRTPAEAWLYGQPMELNEASKEDLELIDGVGPKLAARIAAAQPIASYDELDRVKGVGRKLRAAFEKETIIRAPTSPPTPQDSSAR